MLLAWMVIPRTLLSQLLLETNFLKALFNVLLLNKIQLELQQDFLAGEKFHFVQHLLLSLQEPLIKLEQLVLEEIQSNLLDLTLDVISVKMGLVRWLWKIQDCLEIFLKVLFQFLVMAFLHRKLFNQSEIIMMDLHSSEHHAQMFQCYTQIIKNLNLENVNNI